MSKHVTEDLGYVKGLPTLINYRRRHSQRPPDAELPAIAEDRQLVRLRRMRSLA